MSKMKTGRSWGGYIPAKLVDLSTEQLYWIYRIILLLRVADEEQLRGVFFLTAGFMGVQKPVSEPDTTN